MDRFDDPKIPNSEATQIARKLVRFLKPRAEKLIVAGSLRRRKALVADIEILFLPKLINIPDPGDFLGGTVLCNVTELAINALIEAEIVSKRPNVNGVCSWGEKNKFGIHVESGIAIDFFTATPANWFNYLVCRTGGAVTNIEICNAAIQRGWKWNPYGDGFSRGAEPKQSHAITSEREVFDFVGLHYREPWDRK